MSTNYAVLHPSEHAKFVTVVEYIFQHPNPEDDALPREEGEGYNDSVVPLHPLSFGFCGDGTTNDNCPVFRNGLTYVRA